MHPARDQLRDCRARCAGVPLLSCLTALHGADCTLLAAFAIISSLFCGPRVAQEPAAGPCAATLHLHPPATSQSKAKSVSTAKPKLRAGWLPLACHTYVPVQL
jgi:hypothetical protein